MTHASTAGDSHTRSPSVAALQRSVLAAGLDWIVADWPAPSGVFALTTTRSRRVAGDRRVAHRAGAETNDDGAIMRAVDENEMAALLPSPPIDLKQVHGANVIVYDAESIAAARHAPPVADAAVTRLRGVVCAVATADCLPVVFANRRGDTIGIAHAGWRGLAAGVLEATIVSMTNDGSDPRNLIAWLGPAIGPSMFEVGADVFAAFCGGDPGAAECLVPHREGKWLADLYALARRRLLACGVGDISGAGWCTYSDATRFHSYRRERGAGRMRTLVWLAPGAIPR